MNVHQTSSPGLSSISKAKMAGVNNGYCKLELESSWEINDKPKGPQLFEHDDDMNMNH